MDTAHAEPPQPAPAGRATFGALLRQYRLAAGLSQETLAERAGLSVQGLSALENGKRRAPYRHTVSLLARALGLAATESAALEASVVRGRVPAGGAPSAAPVTPERTVGAVPAAGRAPEAPPLSSRQAHPTNLPVALTSFIGREREQDEVRALLQGARLVTLTGAGGAGKTRLALAVAGELLAAYPEGLWLVELASLAGTTLGGAPLVVQAVAAALGLREEVGHPLRETLLVHLKEKHLLLVLDNCEHLVAVCAELVTVLLGACPRLTILATSREGLGVAGERLYRVPSLAVPDLQRLPAPDRLGEYAGVALFLDRARERRADFALSGQNARAVAQVCARLDGMPLAIELAAARVGSLPVEAMAARLDDRFRLLTGGPRTAVPRQQTLRATLDWSHDLLTEPEQLLLHRLSVFAGGCTLEAAEAVCAGEGVEAWEVLDLLGGLVNKSLVLLEEAGLDGEQGRYRLLETVRQYAHEQLAAAEVVRERHLAYYLALAEEAEPRLTGPEQGRWLVRLEREHDNLRAALAWSLRGAGPGETGLRLAHALGRFWLMHCHQSEGRQWLAQALAAGAGEVTALRARALRAASHLALHQGEHPEAQARLEESLALCRELGDKKGMGDALTNLGYVASCQSDYPRAWARLEEGLILLREHGDTWGTGLALLDLGSVALYQGDYPQARPPLAEGLALFGELGDKWGIGVALARLGLVALYQGGYPEARTRLAESLALFGELGDKVGIRSALAGLGMVALHQGKYAEARARLDESLALARERRDKHGIRSALTGLGLVALAQDDYGRAVALLAEALALLREQGDKQGIADALNGLGTVACRQGDYRQAGRLYAESLTLCRTMGDKRLSAEVLEGLAGVAAARGQAQTAAQLLGATDSLRAAIGAPVPPPRRLDYERTVAAARAALSEGAWAAARAAGQALPLEAAVVLALEDRASPE